MENSSNEADNLRSVVGFARHLKEGVTNCVINVNSAFRAKNHLVSAKPARIGLFTLLLAVGVSACAQNGPTGLSRTILTANASMETWSSSRPVPSRLSELPTLLGYSVKRTGEEHNCRFETGHQRPCSESTGRDPESSAPPSAPESQPSCSNCGHEAHRPDS